MPTKNEAMPTGPREGVGEEAAPVEQAGQEAVSPNEAPREEVAGAWVEQLSGEHRDYAEMRGWKTAMDLLRSYRDLERKLGEGRRVFLPEEGDRKAWDRVYDKLGRPQSAKDYVLEVPDGLGVNQGLSQSMREAFHAAGLNQGQVETLTKTYHAYLAEAINAERSAAEAMQMQAMEDLRREWAGRFDGRVALATQAFRRFAAGPDMGLERERLAAFLAAPGLLRIFADIGQSMSEDELVGQGPLSFRLSPMEAKKEYDRLLADPSFKTALTDERHPGHREANETRARLIRIMAEED